VISIPAISAVTISLGGSLTASSAAAGVFFARNPARMAASPALEADANSDAATSRQRPFTNSAAYSMAPAMTGAPDALETIRISLPKSCPMPGP
jgi:hypothetical protein